MNWIKRSVIKVKYVCIHICIHILFCLCLVAQLCSTLCDPMGILQARILEWVACDLLQGIFPTQGSNPGFLHWRQILYHLSHQGSSWIPEWVVYPFFRASSRPRNWTRISYIAGKFLTSWVTKEVISIYIHIYTHTRTCVCMLAKLLHCVRFFVTLWTITHQAPLSVGFSRQQYWSGLPFPSPRDLPDPGMETKSLVSPWLAGRFFTISAMWEYISD